MSKAALTPLKDLRVSRYQVPSFGLIPNTSIQGKPLMVYHSAFGTSTSAARIENHLNSVGVVSPQWRYTMYSTTHFHSSAHEVLGIASGQAKLCFGGEENPERVEATVSQGDVIVLPAGVGHRLLEDLKGGFEMVGSYPIGKHWDMCYGKKGEEENVSGIKSLDWFSRDPVYGDQGPALDT